GRWTARAAPRREGSDMDRKVKLLLGFADDKKEVELDLPDDEPTPWDLNAKLGVAGKPHARADAIAKVTGRAKYTFDVNLPGMLLGGSHRSPRAKAVIKSVDTSAAEKVTGVHAVLRDFGAGASERVRYAGQPIVAIAAETRQALEEAISLVKVEYEVQPHAAR